MEYFYSGEIVLNTCKQNIRDSNSLVFKPQKHFQDNNGVQNMFGKGVCLIRNIFFM